MAHTDSVPAGPGACDDGCGTATLLETIRALKARALPPAIPSPPCSPMARRAACWARPPGCGHRMPPSARVVNFEARGNRGPSFLFQTSPGDARLIDLYAASVAHTRPRRCMPKSTRCCPTTPTLRRSCRQASTGYNFALVGNVAQYHSGLDRRENIEPASLQQLGEGALGLATSLRQADFAQLKSGNAIYTDVLGRWLPRLPASWALPLSLLAFVLIALAGLLGRRQEPCAATAIGQGADAAAAGGGMPEYGLSAAWHCGLGFRRPRSVFCLSRLPALVAGLRRLCRGAGGGAWGRGHCLLAVGVAALAVVTAAYAPGLSPYFLFPSLVAGPLLLVTLYGGRGPALTIAAVAGLVPWIGLTAGAGSDHGPDAASFVHRHRRIRLCDAAAVAGAGARRGLEHLGGGFAGRGAGSGGGGGFSTGLQQGRTPAPETFCIWNRMQRPGGWPIRSGRRPAWRPTCRPACGPPRPFSAAPVQLAESGFCRRRRRRALSRALGQRGARRRYRDPGHQGIGAWDRTVCAQGGGA